MRLLFKILFFFSIPGCLFFVACKKNDETIKYSGIQFEDIINNPQYFYRPWFGSGIEYLNETIRIPVFAVNLNQSNEFYGHLAFDTKNNTLSKVQAEQHDSNFVLVCSQISNGKLFAYSKDKLKVKAKKKGHKLVLMNSAYQTEKQIILQDSLLYPTWMGQLDNGNYLVVGELSISCYTQNLEFLWKKQKSYGYYTLSGPNTLIFTVKNYPESGYSLTTLDYNGNETNSLKNTNVYDEQFFKGYCLAKTIEGFTLSGHDERPDRGNSLFFHTYDWNLNLKSIRYLKLSNFLKNSEVFHSYSSLIFHDNNYYLVLNTVNDLNFNFNSDFNYMEGKSYLICLDKNFELKWQKLMYEKVNVVYAPLITIHNQIINCFFQCKISNKKGIQTKRYNLLGELMQL